MLDRRLDALLVVHARRRWPALRLVPVWGLRPALVPARRRLRRRLVIAAAATAPVLGCVATIVA